MGINQFSVYTDEEFKQIFLTELKPTFEPITEEEVMIDDVNGEVDWVARGKVSPVKNQGRCGSCWAFSATGVAESWALMSGKTVSLSEQQLVDCSRPYGNQGCNGGWPSSALKYIKDHGIASES